MNNDASLVAATTCSACCYLAMLDASDELVSDYGDLHEQPDGSRGTIAIARRAAERVREHVPCDGPLVNHDAHLTCPLADLFTAAITLAASRPPTGRFAVPADKIVNAGRARTPGQFL